MLKTRYRFTPQDELTGNFHYYNASAGMPGGLTKEQYQQNPSSQCARSISLPDAARICLSNIAIRKRIASLKC